MYRIGGEALGFIHHKYIMIIIIIDIIVIITVRDSIMGSMPRQNHSSY